MIKMFYCQVHCHSSDHNVLVQAGRLRFKVRDSLSGGTCRQRRTLPFGLAILLQFVLLMAPLHGADILPSGESKVELHTEPSVTEIAKGNNFILTVRLSYYGAQSYWHLKSIEGPEIKGAEQVSHSVSSDVRTENSLVICQEIHRFVFHVTGSESVDVGSVKVIVAGQKDDIRHLSSNPFSVKVSEDFLSRTVEVSYVHLILGSILIVVLFIIVRVRRKGLFRKDRSEIPEEEKSDESTRKVDELLGRLEVLNSPSVFDDVKAFYGSSIALLREGLLLNGVEEECRNNDAIVAALDKVPNLPEGLKSGLCRFVEEEKLVRFAGLKPTSLDCEQVCSRLKEFIVLNVDPEEQD